MSAAEALCAISLRFLGGKAGPRARVGTHRVPLVFPLQKPGNKPQCPITLELNFLDRAFPDFGGKCAFRPFSPGTSIQISGKSGW